MAEERIQKIMSEQGLCSRRAAEQIIAEGRVKVNGHPVKVGDKMDPNRDVLHVDDERIYIQKNQQMYYLALYKPRGYVTTASDELGRKTVMDLVTDIPARLYPVGRLDKDSEGLLLMTNDGAFAQAVTHPSGGISKLYRVTVQPRADESQILKLSSGVVLDDGTKTMPCAINVVTDEPGRTVMETVSFNNMARDLDQLEELTRGFISNVSHEFKTPMTTIGGFVDGMIDGTIPLDQRDKYLKIIAEETKRLSRMVNRMLDAAKIQSGELILSPAPFDFTEMTAQILLSFEQKIEKKKLDVQCDLEERLTVMGDRDHLYRVVYNLTDNAVKFIEDGGTLRLKVHQEGQLCVFAISNTGIGISAEDLPHVFDRFYKTDRSRSMDKTGAGLGLYIVKNIINLHGGEISVRSGGGETEFEFTLPLAPEQNRQNNA